MASLVKAAPEIAVEPLTGAMKPRPRTRLPRIVFRPAGALLGITFGLAAVGCGGRTPGQPEIAPVSGTVTLDGRPLTGVSVVFESDKGVVSYGNTDDRGRYSVSYIRSARGAGVGKNVVRIRTPSMGPSSPLNKDRIPSIYNSASILTVDVADRRNVFDFALESKSGSE